MERTGAPLLFCARPMLSFFPSGLKPTAWDGRNDALFRLGRYLRYPGFLARRELGSPGAGITPDIGAGNAQQQTEPTEPDRNEHSGCDIAHSCRPATE
jgi:hypothetical protein